MTPKQHQMLADIATGSDPNLIAQIAGAFGGRQERDTARTLMALFRKGMLRIAKGGGLEISEAGRQAVSKRAKVQR